MINICECPPSQVRPVTQSNRCRLLRCTCGQYWLQLDIDPAARPATEAEAALAEMVSALVRIKLPVSTATHRAPARGRNG